MYGRGEWGRVFGWWGKTVLGEGSDPMGLGHSLGEERVRSYC